MIQQEINELIEKCDKQYREIEENREKIIAAYQHEANKCRKQFIAASYFIAAAYIVTMAFGILYGLSLFLIHTILLICEIICYFAFEYDKSFDYYSVVEKGRNAQAIYTKITDELDRVKKDPDIVCRARNETQSFCPVYETKAVYKEGVTGVMTMRPKSGLPILESIYGNNEPTAKTEMSTSIPLRTEEDMQRWKNITQVDEIQVPCVVVSMFPNIMKDRLTYIIPCQADDSAADAFQFMCMTIAYDIIRKKLQRWETLKDGDSRPITAKDIRQYFVKANGTEPMAAEAQEIMEALADVENVICRQPKEQIEMLAEALEEYDIDELNPRANPYAKELKKQYGRSNDGTSQGKN